MNLTEELLQAGKYLKASSGNWTGVEQFDELQSLLSRAASAIEQLQALLEQEKTWKNEDPRMLREQLRIADAAYQRLHEDHQQLQKHLAERKCLSRHEENTTHG